MTDRARKKFVLTAGGTGGHVFPAEALARELIEEGCDISFITDRRGGSFSGKFPQTAVHRVFARGYAGKNAVSKLWGLFLLGIGVLQSLWILKRLKPDAVVGFGGYAAFPASFAATLLGIPLILHEQNAVLGGANRVLAPRCRLIATTFPSVSRIPAGIPTVYTGVPVRPDILALNARPYPPVTPPFEILITGGSQGAKIFSGIVPDALKMLPETFRAGLKITQQCRPADMPRVAKAYENSGLNVELAPFFSDMPDRLKKAHLVICRAGASTIAELAVSGRPAVLVPILHAADGHQRANALFLAEAGGAWLCTEPEFTPDWLAFKIQELFHNPKMLITASVSAKRCGNPDAAKRLAQAVLQTAGG